MSGWSFWFGSPVLLVDSPPWWAEEEEVAGNEEPKSTVSLAKSIGNKWRNFKDKVLVSQRESLDPATFLESSEFRQLLESTVQEAVEKSIKEVTDKYSSIIKKLEEDLEKQKELVKKLEESVKSDENVSKEEPMEPEDLKEPPMESEETEMIGHDKKLADIRSVGRTFKDSEPGATPVSVGRMNVQNEASHLLWEPLRAIVNDLLTSEGKRKKGDVKDWKRILPRALTPSEMPGLHEIPKEYNRHFHGLLNLGKEYFAKSGTRTLGPFDKMPSKSTLPPGDEFLILQRMGRIPDSEKFIYKKVNMIDT